MGEQRPEYRDVRGFIPETLQRGFQPYWVTPDDLLITRVKNSQAGIIVQTSGRIWHADGSVNEFTFPYVPTSDRSVNNFSQQLEYGWLTNLFVTGGGAQFSVRGQTLVSIVIARPPVGSFVSKTLLAQDYLTSLNGPFWPYPRSVQGYEGPGVFRSIVVGAPAAGSDWSTGAPGNSRWRIRGGVATLLTSAVAGVRQVGIIFTDPTIVRLFQIESASTQLASTTQLYDLVPGYAPTALISTHQPIGIPLDMQLQAGFTIQSTTVGLLAGDQWSNIQLSVEEWIAE